MRKRLHGDRKFKRDEEIRKFYNEFPHYTRRELAEKWGLDASTITRILPKEVTKKDLEVTK